MQTWGCNTNIPRHESRLSSEYVCVCAVTCVPCIVWYVHIPTNVRTYVTGPCFTEEDCNVQSEVMWCDMRWCEVVWSSVKWYGAVWSDMKQYVWSCLERGSVK